MIILAVKSGIFLLVIFSGIVSKNLTRDLALFLILFLFLLSLLAFIDLVFLFDKHDALPDDFSCKNFYLLLVIFPGAVPKSAGFWGPLLVAPSTGGLRCGVNLV